MRYSGLEIELLPDGKELFKDLARFAGRKLLYHQANPEDDELRVGKIEFDRDIRRFVFNYWWKTYLSGIKDVKRFVFNLLVEKLSFGDKGFRAAAAGKFENSEGYVMLIV
jgi:hypothetical protein